MMLHEPLCSAARACLSAARPRAPPPPGGACGSRAPPRCPPCAPAPRPPCRAHAPAPRRATLLVCCPPPPGQRPPCAPPPVAPSLSCQDYIRQIRKQSRRAQVEVPSHHVKFPCELDAVAKRLKMAKRARQAQYEQEVAERAARCAGVQGVPPTTYVLGAERECARATDGCLYAVPRPAPPPRCGPHRTPPPPRCFELAPDDGCRIQGERRLDPCAHRPRVIVHVDRSALAEHSPAPPAHSPAAAPAPPRCQRPTIAEQLRSRSAPSIYNSREKRNFHTSATLPKNTKSYSSGSLDAMVRSKENLREAGRGRVVLGDSKKRDINYGGKLEMCVPTGTERLSVLVSLQGASDGGFCTAHPPAPRSTSPSQYSTRVSSAKSTTCSRSKFRKRHISPCGKLESGSKKRDSWLSRWPDCRRTEGVTGSKTSSSSKNTGCPNSPHSLNANVSRIGGLCAKSSELRAIPGEVFPKPNSPSAKSSQTCVKPQEKSAVPDSCVTGNNTKPATKQCSSTTTFIANTVLPSS